MCIRDRDICAPFLFAGKPRQRKKSTTSAPSVTYSLPHCVPCPVPPLTPVLRFYQFCLDTHLGEIRTLSHAPCVFSKKPPSLGMLLTSAELLSPLALSPPRSANSATHTSPGTVLIRTDPSFAHRLRSSSGQLFWIFLSAILRTSANDATTIHNTTRCSGEQTTTKQFRAAFHPRERHTWGSSRRNLLSNTYVLW